MAEEEQKNPITEKEQEVEVFEDDKPVIKVETDSSETENLKEEEIPEVEDARKADEVVKGIEIPFDVQAWHPKTELGRQVKAGEVVELSEPLSQGIRILEPEVVDYLIPGNESDLLLIGQAKGKFGGGQRRVFRQCQKKTREGNKPSFATVAVIGNKNGFVGLGYGKARETVPAREKALRNAKRNVIMIKRGSGSWEGAGEYPNSIPFAVQGKCGSVTVELIPAPNGTGLCIEAECAKILRLAGIQDVWSRTRGQAKTKVNQVKACFEALKKLSSTKVRAADVERFNIVTGKVV